MSYGNPHSIPCYSPSHWGVVGYNTQNTKGPTDLGNLLASLHLNPQDSSAARISIWRFNMSMTTTRSKVFLAFAILMIPLFAVSAVDPDACTRCGPGFLISPHSLDFGPQRIGTHSPSQPIFVRSVGSFPLQISKIVELGAGFTQTNNCPAKLQLQHFCSINVIFAPTTAKMYSGKIKMITNAGTAIVPLTGTGVAQ